jgi:hypothetical protein
VISVKILGLKFLPFIAVVTRSSPSGRATRQSASQKPLCLYGLVPLLVHSLILKALSIIQCCQSKLFLYH